MQRDPKGWAVVQLLPSFLGMEPGELAKEDHTPGKGLLPGLRDGILIPLSPSRCSQASQSQLAASGMEDKNGTTVPLRLGSTEATVVSLHLMMWDDDDGQ